MTFLTNDEKTVLRWLGSHLGEKNYLLCYFTSDFKTKLKIKIRFKYIFKRAMKVKEENVPKIFYETEKQGSCFRKAFVISSKT